MSDFFFHINDIVYLTGEITNGQTTGTIILSLHPIFNSYFVFHKNVEINVYNRNNSYDKRVFLLI